MQTQCGHIIKAEIETLEGSNHDRAVIIGTAVLADINHAAGEIILLAEDTSLSGYVRVTIPGTFCPICGAEMLPPKEQSKPPSTAIATPTNDELTCWCPICKKETTVYRKDDKHLTCNQGHTFSTPGDW